MAQRKAQFLTKLSDLLAGRNEISGGDFLKMTFFFCRDCNQGKIEPSSLFTKEEREKTDQDLIDSFPYLERDMHHVTKLGWESAMYLRLVRSGLEFIRESFAVDNAWLEYELDEMMDCEEIESLDILLESFEGMRGEYDFGDDCVDLRGVPESHTWWCNDERVDSIRRFGTGCEMSVVDNSSFYTSNFSLPINKNIFAKINKSRLDKLFKSRHRGLFQRFLDEHFFGENELGAQLWEANAIKTEFWKVYYKGGRKNKHAGTYYVSTEKVLNALHFIRARYEEATLKFDDLISDFETEVFYETNENQKLTNEEWVGNVCQHVTNMYNLLGTNLMDQILSEVLSPEISEIYHSETSTFNPESQWKIQAIEILSKELFQIKNNLEEFGFPERLQEIVESYIAECDESNDQSRFCHFISYVSTVADNVQKLIRKGKVLDISSIANREDLFDLLLPQPPEDFEFLLPASPNSLKEIRKVEKGFGNSIDFHWNVKCIKDWVKDQVCPAVLKECVESNDPSEQLRKLNALGEKIFSQNVKSIDSVHNNPTLKIVNFDAGVVAVYKRTNKAGEKTQYFLQMISKIANPETVKADSLKVLFNPNRLVEDFVKMEKAYEECIEEEENPSSKYYIHPSGQHKNGSINNDCWCSKDSFSEDDIRASVLRYLADNPQMKNASAGAAHSTKHYKENAEKGQDWIDRLDMLRGVNLKYHIKQYLSNAKKLEGETEEEWLKRLRSKLTCSFGNSGVFNVAFGIWSGGNDGIFVHLSITKDNEIFIKALFTGKPASRKQAECFGLEEVWDRENPIKVDIKEGSGYVESNRRLN